MRGPRIGAWFRREDYEALKKLSPNEPDLPDTFDEWEQIATKQVAEIETAGGLVEKVIIDPQEFAIWCRASGVKPDSVNRSAFAVQKHFGQQKGGA